MAAPARVRNRSVERRKKLLAEAFVKTIKRDYARVSAKPDAASVLRQLDAWFEHYNRVHPHKALGYRSPREFRKQFIRGTTEDAVGTVLDRMTAQRPRRWSGQGQSHRRRWRTAP